MQFSEKARTALALCQVLGLALGIAGCRSADTSDPGIEATPAPPPAREPRADTPDPAELEALLDAAELAMHRQHYDYPAAGSALVLYDAVLARDPHNAEARRGLERIAEHYLTEAETAAHRRQFVRARSMLDRARVVDVEHPALQATERQVRLLQDARRERLILDKTLLSERSELLLPDLRRMGDAARSNGCRALLRARSDAEGRWLYQQMSRGSGYARIQAEIEIGSPPAVELICFRTDS